MKKHLFVLACLVALISSCSNSKSSIETDSTQLQRISIDLEKNTWLSLDSIVEKVDFIRLQTTDKAIIGRISQLFIQDSLIIVVDKEQTKSITIFNMKGEIQHRISAKGNGPSEYVELSNVSIVPHKKQIAIVDRPQCKTIFYSYDGTFVSTEKDPFMFSYFEYLESGNKVFSNYSLHDPKLGDLKDSALIVTDANNKVKYGSFEDWYSTDFTYTKNRILRKYRGKVYYSPNVTNYIYEISDSKIVAKYLIDIVKNGVPELTKGIKTDDFFKMLDTHYAFNGDFVELKNHTFVNIMSPNGYPFVVYSHKRKETFISTGKGSNPLLAFLNSAPQTGCGDNCVVVDVASSIVKAVKSDFYKNATNTDDLNRLYDGLTEDDNPVLFLYHLNENL